MGNLPIGQGLAVTPMQIATAYAAIANGGILRSPTLIRSIGGQPVDEDTDPHRVISPRVAAQLRRMLEGVLEPGGTASSVSVPGYVLAGKTGTAQKVENGTYSDTDYVASFVGFAPAQRRSCWSRWWSTSRRTCTSAAPSPPRSSARSPPSRCPTSGISP